MQAESLALRLALSVVGVNTKPSSVKSSSSLGITQNVPEEENRAQVLVFSAEFTRVCDIEELPLAIARIETLVTVWPLVADQEIDLGHTVVVVACERSALSRWKEGEVVLTDLSESSAQGVGAGLEMPASTVAVDPGKGLGRAGEQRGHDGKGWKMHGV